MSEKRMVNHITDVREDNGEHDGNPRADVRSSLADGHHNGDDRAGASQQRGPQRHERDVDVLIARVGRPGVGSHEELHGDQEQQDAAGELESLHRDVEEAQDLAAQDSEGEDDPERHRGRLDRGPPLLVLGVAGGQSQEDRHGADRVHDDRQRRDGRGKESNVEEAHGATTSICP